MLTYKIQFLSALFLGGLSLSMAQIGVSTASVSMNRNQHIQSPDQVVVEDYVNYHRHNIAMPKGKEQVKLSLDYRTLNENKGVLQVGVATKSSLDYSQLPPVNISLVIDGSGSMQSNRKIGNVKQAIKKFVKGLRPGDYISIVVYNSNARVTLKSIQVNEMPSIDHVLSKIYASGSTNLNEGLIQGYKEVERHYKLHFTNKVILFTDGIANVGTTDPERIIENSLAYNKKGIDVSTIGVGTSLNYKLLQQIAATGKGSNHFIGDNKEDIEKAFNQELESVLSSIGRDVYIDIELPKHVEIEKIYGYTPEYKDQTVRIPLEHLAFGQTQVVLVEFSTHNSRKKINLKTTLSYKVNKTSEKEYKTSEKEYQSKVLMANLKEPLPFNGGEPMKNYYIAKMASALKQTSSVIEKEDHKEGLRIINYTLNEIDEVFPYLKDQDISRIKDILLKTKSSLDDRLSYQNESWNTGLY